MAGPKSIRAGLIRKSFFIHYQSLTEMFKNLPSQDFAAEMAKYADAVLLDVRTEAEFSEAHLPNALNLNIMFPDFQDELEKLDTSKAYFVYCRSGARSASACNLMSAIGFENVTNLAGGIISWKGEVVR